MTGLTYGMECDFVTGDSMEISNYHSLINS